MKYLIVPTIGINGEHRWQLSRYFEPVWVVPARNYVIAYFAP